MKRVLYSILNLILISSCTSGNRNFPSLNDFKLLLADSVTVLNTADIPLGKPFILIYFDPDCNDCQNETEDILKNIKLFENVDIYFITDMPFDRLKVFNAVYKIPNHQNIILAKDYDNSFRRLYTPTGTPHTIVFDSDRKMRAVFSGRAKIENLSRVIGNLE